MRRGVQRKFRQECLGARRHCRSDQWRSNGNFLTLADTAETGGVAQVLQ
jgi:hypothetical protein